MIRRACEADIRANASSGNECAAKWKENLSAELARRTVERKREVETIVFRIGNGQSSEAEQWNIGVWRMMDRIRIPAAVHVAVATELETACWCQKQLCDCKTSFLFFDHSIILSSYTANRSSDGSQRITHRLSSILELNWMPGESKSRSTGSSATHVSLDHGDSRSTSTDSTSSASLRSRRANTY